jgi:hypothetical protein
MTESPDDLRAAHERIRLLKALIHEHSMPRQHAPGWTWVAVGGTLPPVVGVITLIVYSFIAFAGIGAPPPPPPPPVSEYVPPPPPKPTIGATWYPQSRVSPIVTDIDHDGKSEFIGLAWGRHVDRQLYVVAFDGDSLEPRWHAGPYPGTWRSEITHLVVVGDKAVVTDAANVVHVLALATGEEQRSSTFADGATHVCAAGADAVLLNAECCNDLGVKSMSLSTGQVTTAAKGVSCNLVTDKETEPQSGLLRPKGDDTIQRLAKTKGFWGRDTYSSSGDRVTLGYVSANEKTHTEGGSYALGWDAKTRKIRWEEPLIPAGDKDHSGGTFEAVDADRIYFAYQADRTPTLGPQRVIARKFTTGEIAWKTTLPESAEGSLVTSLGAGAGHVFIVMNHALYVLDAETGALQATRGDF